MNWTRGDLVAEGKTKKVFRTKEDPDMGIFVGLNNITAHDDPSFTKQFDAKPRLATQTTCNVFRLLKACGLPVTFEQQISETEFVAPIVEMIPLEVIARRVADGSYLKRMPQFKRPDGKLHQFHSLKTEFFLKTTGGELVKGGKKLVKDLPQIPASEPGTTKPLDDPFITNPENQELWDLAYPKKPGWEKGAILDHKVVPADVLFPVSINLPAGKEWTVEKIMKILDELNRKAFYIMERAWGLLGYKLGDWKLEFGWTKDGQIVIADVIDNDSWRLRDKENREKSKQVFRDHGLTEEVEINYAMVSSMSDQFRLPRQALVIWKGSPDDPTPEVPDIPGLEKVEIALSGHKKTHAGLDRLEELLRDYPDGGVIVIPVGMSNGLGPVISSHTSWPAAGVPVTAKEFPEDVWSSLRLPSQNPMATILSPKNAVLFALNILAQTNPAAYMVRQMAIESLDSGY